MNYPHESRRQAQRWYRRKEMYRMMRQDVSKEKGSDGHVKSGTVDTAYADGVTQCRLSLRA